MAYGYVHLPVEFVTLLQSNMQTSGDGYSMLKKSLWQMPHFQSVVARATGDLGNRMSFEQIINTLGWLGLRDRLAGQFLHHQRDGHFSSSTTLETLEDILDFEARVKNISLNGYSRAFLFGFYLKMGYFEEQVSMGKPISNRTKLVSDEIFEVLDSVKTRISHLDWLCLSLHYLIRFRGLPRVRALVGSGGGFMALRSELTKQQEFTMMKAFLAYGASINHHEAFYNPMV